MAITDEIPRSRITLTYRTTVNGEPEDVTLPFRLLVMGDLSKGSSKDSEQPLEKRQIRKLDGKNLDHVMSDMRMSVTFDVKNAINPKSGGETFPVTLPIKSTKSFLPAEVAKEVPRIKALLLLKKLLTEAQNNFDNSRDFRKLLRDAAQDPASMLKLVAELPAFLPYKLPAAKLKLTVDAAVAALPKLEIKRAMLVPNPASKVAGAEIRKDEEIVEPSAFNQEVRVIPGKYEIRAFAPGKKPWVATIVVKHDTVETQAVGPLADET